MKKAKMKFIVVFFVFLFILALFVDYISLPLILYVESNELSSIKLDKPKPIGLSYRVRYIKEDKYSPDMNADLVLLDPCAKVLVIDSKCARWGRVDESVDINILVDDEKIWACIEQPIAFIYPDSSSIANRILDLHLDWKGVSYSGRISNVNIDIIKEDIADYDEVAIFDPSSALALIREDINKSIIVDFRDKDALKMHRNVKVITPKWSKAIEEALALDSGNISLDFALR